MSTNRKGRGIGTALAFVLAVAATAPAWARIPLSAYADHITRQVRFEQNVGQTDSAAHYVARCRDLTAFFADGEAILSLPSGTVRMRFAGGNSTAGIDGLMPLEGSTNYFLGRDPTAWHRHVPAFGQVRYRDVWPGIDVIFRSHHATLEYDVIIAPGSKPALAQVQFAGASSVSIDASGNLVLAVGTGSLVQRPPRVYQEIAGVRREVRARHVQLGGGLIGFEVGDYDPAFAVVIDPTLEFSSYLGSSASDEAFGVATGKDGSVYIAGATSGIDFPTTNGTAVAGRDVYVAKFDSSGTQLEYATVIGGSESDDAFGVRVDSQGAAYVGGTTNSTDFPVTVGAFDPTHGGGGGDGFVLALDPSGMIVFSSFLGGSGDDWVGGIAVRGKSVSEIDIAVQGGTASLDFPVTPSAYQVVHAGWDWTDESRRLDAFVTAFRIRQGSMSLRYSSFLGGSQTDLSRAIDIDDSHLYVAGGNGSVHSTRNRGIFWNRAEHQDGAVLRSVLWCGAEGPAYAGGTGYGNQWVQDLTKSFTLPDGAVELRFHAQYDTEQDFDFIRIDVSADGGESFSQLGELSGISDNYGEHAFDLSEHAGQTILVRFRFASDEGFSDEDGILLTEGAARLDWVEVSGHERDEFDLGTDGWVASDGYTPFPATVLHGASGGPTDAFVAKINPARSGARSMAYVASIGGEGAERAVAVRAYRGQATASGHTTSVDFPTTSRAFQRELQGAVDVFVTRLAIDGSQLGFATYLGGTSSDLAGGLAVDRMGRMWVSGQTFSVGAPFVTADALQPTAGGDSDAFFAGLAADGRRVFYGTYLGGPNFDDGGPLDIDDRGNLYFIGATMGHFPVTAGAYDETFNGDLDTFVVKISF